MTDAQKLHPSLTLEVVKAAVARRIITTDNPGFCVACGAEVDGVEPDADGYDCEACGEPKVYGAEEILIGML